MAPFHVVGSYLRGKYHNGVFVTVDQNSNELMLADAKYAINPPRDVLVFLEDSPDYCVPNSITGSLGTTGRVCNKTTPGHGSCKFLCCGRGFNTIQIVEEYQCSCKFYWCCYVNCNTCTRTVDRHFCKSNEKASKDSGSWTVYEIETLHKLKIKKKKKSDLHNIFLYMVSWVPRISWVTNQSGGVRG